MMRGGDEGRTPRHVLLWGIDDRAEHYLRCLDEAGMQPVAWVDGAHQDSEYRGVPVVSPRECERTSYRYAHLPLIVVGGGVGGPERSGFDDAVRVIVNDLDLPVRVFHGAFLADHVRVNQEGQVFLLGFPGAGSGALHPVLAELVSRRATPLGAKEAFLADLARDYHEHTLIPALEGLFDLGGRHASQASTVAGDRVRLELQLSHERLAMLLNLRSKPCLFEAVHTSHEAPGDDVLERARRLGRTVVVTVRHPLDLIVSWAARLSHPPEAVVASLEWFRHMASAVQAYYEAALQQGHRTVLCKYEDLVDHPGRTIQTVAHALGVDMGQSEAEDLWERVGFRRVLAPPVGAAGRWHAGRESWRAVLGPAHVDVLTALRFPELLAALGYDASLETGPGSSAADVPPDPGNRRDAAYLDFGLEVLVGKPVQFRSEQFHHHVDPMLGVELFANDANLWSLVKTALSSRYFRTRLTALWP